MQTLESVYVCPDPSLVQEREIEPPQEPSLHAMMQLCDM